MNIRFHFLRYLIYSLYVMRQQQALPQASRQAHTAFASFQSELSFPQFSLSCRQEAIYMILYTAAVNNDTALIAFHYMLQ